MPFYERDDFLVFDHFLDPNSVQQFRQDLRAYEEDGAILRAEGTITEPGKQEIRSIFGIHERFDRLTRAGPSPKRHNLTQAGLK